MADKKLIKQLREQIITSLATDEWERRKGSGSCYDQHYFSRGAVEILASIRNGRYYLVFCVKAKGVGVIDNIFFGKSFYDTLRNTLNKRWSPISNDNVIAAINSLK